MQRWKMMITPRAENDEDIPSMVLRQARLQGWSSLAVLWATKTNERIAGVIKILPGKRPRYNEELDIVMLQ